MRLTNITGETRERDTLIALRRLGTTKQDQPMNFDNALLIIVSLTENSMSSVVRALSANQHAQDGYREPAFICLTAFLPNEPFIIYRSQGHASFPRSRM